MSNLINLGLAGISFRDLADNSQAIHDGFVAEAAVYTGPVPTMPDFQDHIDALEAAITAWGPPEARGSREQHDDLVTAAKVVKADLKQLSAYAMGVVPNDPDSWRRLKFGIKRSKSAPKSLQMVQNLHRFQSRTLPDGIIKLKWTRPLDCDPSDVKGYVIQFNNVAVQPDLKPAPDGTRGIVNIWAIQLDTAIVLTPPFVGANYFWVTPFNSLGFGVTADPVYFNAPGKP